MQNTNWRVFVADAFAEKLFGGNQAGVVLLQEGEEFPDAGRMRTVAGELKHSETAFVKKLSENCFQIRYFTPVEEVELCGHATIGAFQVLLEEGVIGEGLHELQTKAQTLTVSVEPGGIWMDMASPRLLKTISEEESSQIYEAYGLSLKDSVTGLFPKIINTGLSDIILPVKNRESLNQAVQDELMVTALSRSYGVVGVHMFCLSDQEKILAECRNFAPLYGIPEEAATGTANGALTYYLYGLELAEENREYTILQGEAMGRPSCIKSRINCIRDGEKEDCRVRIGGNAVISLKGEVMCYG